MPKGDTLTKLQEQFCQLCAYEPTWSDTDCYKEAGYSWENMKPATLHRTAHELRHTPKIAARIDQLRTERMERVQVDADYVLKRLVQIDQLDISDITDESDNLLPVRKWPKVWRTLVSEMEVRVDSKEDAEGVLKKVKFPDKLATIKQIGQHTTIQAFNHKLELSGPGGGPIQTTTKITRRIVRPGQK